MNYNQAENYISQIIYPIIALHYTTRDDTITRRHRPTASKINKPNYLRLGFDVKVTLKSVKSTVEIFQPSEVVFSSNRTQLIVYFIIYLVNIQC